MSRSDLNDPMLESKWKEHHAWSLQNSMLYGWGGGRGTVLS